MGIGKVVGGLRMSRCRAGKRRRGWNKWSRDASNGGLALSYIYIRERDWGYILLMSSLPAHLAMATRAEHTTLLKHSMIAKLFLPCKLHPAISGYSRRGGCVPSYLSYKFGNSCRLFFPDCSTKTTPSKEHFSRGIEGLKNKGLIL